jgi:sterol desaturase/sphingolipid hydroxylase (fatty acid hydroxylase superfamily)
MPKGAECPAAIFCEKADRNCALPLLPQVGLGGSIIPLFFTMTFLSLWVLLNLAKPRLVESKKAVALVLFITLVITLVFHLGVYVLFADFLDYEPNVS